jgi:hypothetical protein
MTFDDIEKKVNLMLIGKKGYSYGVVRDKDIKDVPKCYEIDWESRTIVEMKPQPLFKNGYFYLPDDSYLSAATGLHLS